jgi:hypothetical protein
MGYDFLQKKEGLEKQARVRRRQERFGPNPDLFSRVIPANPSVRFRCQVDSDSEQLQVGDKLLLYRMEGGEVKAFKRLKPVGDLLPEASADFISSFPADNKTDVHLAEVMTAPDPLDQTVDLAIRPPWDDAKEEPKKP